MNSRNTNGALARISHAWIQALRSELHDRAPADFEVWFMDSLTEVTAGWIWTGDSRNVLQKELRAPTICALLVKWQAVDWNSERREARQELA